MTEGRPRAGRGASAGGYLRRAGLALGLATALASPIFVASSVSPASALASAITAWPIESYYAGQGPYATTSTVATDSAGDLFDVYYPANYSALTFLSPIVTWGDGTGSTPADYTTLLGHLASWGFTVIASTLTNTGSGNEILAGAEYLVGEDGSAGTTFFDKLNVNEVAAVGHSQGAGGATRAATNDPSLIKTLMTFSLPNTEWVLTNSDCPTVTDCMYYPSELTQPVFFVGTHGFWDSILASPATENGFYSSVAGQAVVGLIEKSDNKIADHASIENRANGGNPDGFLGYATAWLMYQLRGDTFAAGAFTANSPEIVANTNWPASAAKA
jgi:pimeloyl-ACP methyl ester carboxylesterase